MLILLLKPGSLDPFDIVGMIKFDEVFMGLVKIELVEAPRIPGRLTNVADG